MVNSYSTSIITGQIQEVYENQVDFSSSTYYSKTDIDEFLKVQTLMNYQVFSDNLEAKLNEEVSYDNQKEFLKKNINSAYFQ